MRPVSTRTRHAIHHALPDVLPGLFPGFGEAAPLDLPSLSAAAEQQITELLVSDRFDAWSQALARVGNCARPIRLRGHSERVDTATGEIVSTYSSEQEPLGVTHVRCGNRRAAECPSCSRLYAADMFHLIRAGVVGGKTVPESVGENPLVFATLTAPSFGAVHGRRDQGRRCHPHTHRGPRCAHGRPATCHTAHAEDDPALGQPLCWDCYDYASHVVWQWWAPDLWRRFTITLRRQVAKTLAVPATRLGEVATVQYAKVAEYQLRGVVHFHALVRLDGPRTRDGFAPTPTAIDADQLADLVHAAAASVRLTKPGVDADDPPRVLAFGRQLDARPVRTGRRTDDPDRVLAPEQVAGYLAKYATKSAEDTGVTDNPHHRRIRATARSLSARAKTATTAGTAPDANPYELLGKWVPMLGFRGHFASKSRRYSLTMGALRRARRRAQALIAASRAEDRPLDIASLEADLLAEEDTETTLVVGQWQYVGSGWATEGERILAVAAAARAREYAQWRAEQRKARVMESHVRTQTNVRRG
ncbi:MAG TPA: replication initiator [Nocardioidaceae bacterium]|nr:replication initiator [Nocardioidaceae bacterium]